MSRFTSVPWSMVSMFRLMPAAASRRLMIASRLVASVVLMQVDVKVVGFFSAFS